MRHAIRSHIAMVNVEGLGYHRNHGIDVTAGATRPTGWCLSILFICWGLLLRVISAQAGDARSLEVVETVDGLTVQTSDWKLVFDEAFNGGPVGWFDRAFDPAELDNLASTQTGNYSQGAVFDDDVYLGTDGGNAIEHMTTMGRNAAPGDLELTLLESTPARVRIRQRGHPRLNNGGGPPGDPFAELRLLTFTTEWTLYPTGKIHIEFQTAIDTSAKVVDSGPGGAGKSINANGTSISAGGGTNFLVSGVWAGDTIEYATGGWGPVLVAARDSASQLTLAQGVAPGINLPFVVRRNNIVMETISIHADGDASLVNQCSGPIAPTWKGGSNGDPLWSVPDFSSCRSLLRNQSGGFPTLADDTLLVHWARGRSAGSLLAFFEPWPEATFGAFNDQGFTDISYTQLGRFGVRPIEAQHRHFLAQLGSTTAALLPSIQSVAHADRSWKDYRRPWAAPVEGALASGADITATGFDLATGAYRLAAEPCTPAATCRVAAIRFDSNALDRAGALYVTPAVELEGFDHTLAAGHPDIRVDVSTNGGSSFAALDPALYNLTGVGEEAQVGVGRRLFQHLGVLGGETILRFKGTSQCDSTPRAGCRAARRAKLVLAPGTQPARRTLRWSWVGGPATLQSEFGSPLSDTDTSLCVYAGSSRTLVLEASVAPAESCGARPCWSAVNTRGYRYRRTNGNADGVRSLRLIGGTTDKTRVTLAAKGEALELPPLPLPGTADVVVQLSNSDDSACWESTFAPSAFRRNTSVRFTAVAR